MGKASYLFGIFPYCKRIEQTGASSGFQRDRTKEWVLWM